MFKILDGRKHFFQWDLDRKLVVEDDSITEVHFCNKTDDCSLVCEVYNEDNKRVVNVPNVLLQDNWPINVYAYDGEYTKHSEKFDVVSRSKPADYVYTETEVKRWEDITERVEYLENDYVNTEDVADMIDRALAVYQMPYYKFEETTFAGGTMWSGKYHVNLVELESGLVYGLKPHHNPPTNVSGTTFSIVLDIICKDGTIRNVGSIAPTPNFTIFKNENVWNYFNDNASITITPQGLETANNITYTTQINGKYLSISNNTRYTPTSNYNPATKKYVDDSLTAAKTYTDSKTTEPQYELIKKVEIAEEGIINIAINGFELDKFIIYNYIPVATTTASVGVECRRGSTLAGYAWLASLISSQTARRNTVSGRSENGHTVIESTSPITASPTIEHNVALSRSVRYVPDTEPFTAINMYGSGGSSFPIGTIVELWGVRA